MKGLIFAIGSISRGFSLASGLGPSALTKPLRLGIIAVCSCVKVINWSLIPASYCFQNKEDDWTLYEFNYFPLMTRILAE